MAPQQFPTSKDDLTSIDDAQAGLNPYLTHKPSECRLREPLTRQVYQTIARLGAHSCGDDSNDKDCKFGQWRVYATVLVQVDVELDAHSPEDDAVSDKYA